MSKPNDGGPAFPLTDLRGVTELGYSDGMSLRAYIATQAMAALIISNPQVPHDYDSACVRKAFSESALVFADGLIEELNKPQDE